MTSQTRQWIMAIHILFNISRRKDNQAMKFGQSIKISLRNIFLQKSYKKWGRDTSYLFCFLKRPFIRCKNESAQAL